jgi:hypothetical protein
LLVFTGLDVDMHAAKQLYALRLRSSARVQAVKLRDCSCSKNEAS